jgi:hypothetical protein
MRTQIVVCSGKEVKTLPQNFMRPCVLRLN